MSRRPRKAPAVDPRARVVAYIPLDGYVKDHGWRVSFVVEGEDFHRPTGSWPYTGAPGESLPWFWGHDYNEALVLADSYNEEMGIGAKEAAIIVARSMVGCRGQVLL